MKKGRGPRVMFLGARARITREAAQTFGKNEEALAEAKMRNWSLPVVWR